MRRFRMILITDYVRDFKIVNGPFEDEFNLKRLKNEIILKILLLQ